jgi:hypothetical protein
MSLVRMISNRPRRNTIDEAYIQRLTLGVHSQIGTSDPFALRRLLSKYSLVCTDTSPLPGHL